MKHKDKPKNKPTPEKITHKAWVVFKYISRILLDILLFLAAIGLVASVYFYISTPINTQLLTDKVAQTSVIYDRTGEHVLYEIHGEENRKVIPHEEIPDVMRICTIAAEDSGFYSHSGIDPKAIIRALKADIQNNGMQQGASTITQQLAKNVFLSREKTFRRKISEIVLAFKLERNFTKDQILDMYLNEVPYGSNAYGVQSAARTFFEKDAKDLTLDEAAFLAALPNATTYYSPYGNHQSELIARQQRILDKVKELGLTDGTAAEQAKTETTIDKVVPFKQNISAPHFVFYIKEQLEKMYGQDVVEQGGFKVYTTLDWDKQQLAESAISSQMPALQKKYDATNAALVSVDPKTGEILAMVGSVDYFNQAGDGQVNVATSPRQPGSSFKPFAYATAFEKGYQPETILYDVPTDFGPDGSGQDYKPQNYNGNFNGPVTMRQALANSLNIPAVKTLYLAGIKDTIDMAHRLGITTLQDENRFGLALVLGGGEVTLLDETSAFSVFGNDGRRNPATGISKIIDTNGAVFYQNSPPNTQVIHEQIARKIDSILSDNGARSLVFGTGSKLYIPGRNVAAKTGTTQDFHDAWAVGFTPSLATGVWVGNNDNHAMSSGADGSYVAAPIWNEYMTKALASYPNESFPDYDHSNLRSVDPNSLVKYYSKSSGKEISAEKAKKKDPSKVETRIDTPAFFADGMPSIPELQDTTDPMILRWKQSLQNQDLSNLNSKDNKNNN